MTLNELKDDKIAICVSGGLDSRTVAKKFADLGIEAIGFCADLAQPDEADISDVVEKMDPCGIETVLVDLKDEMADACFMMIRAQAMYDGGYWNSTGIARAVTVKGLIPEMKKRGCNVLAHCATGRGNDQMRFERYTNILAPDMKVYAPWRDPELLKEFPGRTEMVDYLDKAGIKTPLVGKKRYSTDSNLAGISYEAEDLESMNSPMTIVEPQMGVWPSNAPDKAEEVSVKFEGGAPVEINGTAMSPLELMQTANEISGRNGVGIKNALENRILGTKSRGVYEAPGMELLACCLRQVYFAILEKRATALFASMSSLVATQVYEARCFDPSTKAALAAINTLTEHAHGTVRMALYKGNVHFLGLTDCPASLYNEADSSMESSEGLNPVSSQGYAEIQAIEAKALAHSKQI